MLGGKNKQPLGYTIIEVMIVLAISGVMFLIAVQFINGKQGRASFTQGVNDMASNIQDSIEQVTDGRYSDIPVSCAVSGSGLTFTALTSSGSTAANQGTNQDCIFIGKLFHFELHTSHYEVFSLAACQNTTTASGAACGGTGFSYAWVTPIMDTPGGPGDLTTQETVPQNLIVKDVDVTPASYTPPLGGSGANNIAFFQTIGPDGFYDDGNYPTGAQNISLGYAVGGAKDGSIDPTNAGEGTGTTDNVARADIAGNGTYWATSAVVCLTNGSDFAEIDIGDATNNDSTANVNVKMDGSTAC